MRRDLLQEDHLRRSYEAFYDFTEKEREEALKAIRHLEALYKMYGHEFDLRELGDEL
jgi:hypothetical protein